jgi:uncharacterized protein
MPPDAPPALSDATRRALAEGVRRFDGGRYFDAHEIWEDAWRVETGPVRRGLQGLIQIAAGFHKGLVSGSPAGMITLLERGLARLDAAAEAGLVDAARLAPVVEAWLAAARRWAATGERPALALPRLGEPS